VDLAGFAINRNAEPTGSVRRGKYLGQLGLVAGIGKSAGEELLQFDRELVERNLWFGKARPRKQLPQFRQAERPRMRRVAQCLDTVVRRGLRGIFGGRT
jgi:hypothetical protein